MADPPSIVESLDLLDARPETAQGADAIIGRQNLLAALFRDTARHRLGRFEVKKLLGVGAMGSVFEAWDPRLERDVAIKVLHRNSEPSSRDRLFAEAQGLARVRHPGVLTIFEVGEEDERLFLVMELMRGGTMGDWMVEPRSLREVFAAFASPAAGLAAAHEAGLVHRDLKPDNFVLDEAGDAKVSDFGLAISGEPLQIMASAVADLDESGSSTLPSDRFAGTPAYAAPEQFSKGITSNATDVYSLCATLWEAIYGRRPKRPHKEPPLRAGPLRARARVPSSFRRLLRAGLADNPSGRPPAADVASSLSSLSSASSRVWIASAVAATLISGLGAIAYPSVEQVLCESLAGETISTWEDEGRPKISASLSASEHAHVRDLLGRVLLRSNSSVHSLQSLRVQACARSSEAERSKLQACGQRVEDGLAMWTNSLERADDAGRARALEALSLVPSADECWNEPELQGDGAAESPELLQLRRDMSRARLDQEFRPDNAVDWSVFVDRAAKLGPRAGRDLAKAQLGFARANTQHVSMNEALSARYDALATTVEFGSPNEVANIWVNIVLWRGATSQDDFEFSRAESLAIAAAEHQGVTDATRAGLLGSRARFYYERARFEEAAKLQLQAIELYDTTDTHELEMAQFQIQYAQTLAAWGRVDEAVDAARTAVATYANFLPPNHPRVARARGRLATFLSRAGKYEESVIVFKEARIALVDALGPDSYSLHGVLVDYGALGRLGRFDEAIDHALWRLRILTALSEDQTDNPENFRRIVSTRQSLGSFYRRTGEIDKAIEVLKQVLEQCRSLPKNAPAIASAHENLGAAYGDAEQYAVAVKHHTQALKGHEALLGPKAIGVGIAHNNLGNNLMELEGADLQEVIAHYDDALLIFLKHFSEDHSFLAYPYTGRARAHLRTGQPAKARADIDRAIKIREKLDPVELMESQLVGARVDMATGHRDRARATVEAVAEKAEGKKNPKLRSELAELQPALGL